jgi:hypothetical protein
VDGWDLGFAIADVGWVFIIAGEMRLQPGADTFIVSCWDWATERTENTEVP